MLDFLRFDSFLDIDLQTGTKAIAYSGMLGSWFVMIFGLGTLQIFQDYLDTLMVSLVIYGLVLDLSYAGSCVLALKAVRQRSDYKLIPWLVIGFVTSLSVTVAGVTLVAFWVNQYYFLAAACLLLTFLISCLSTYVWLAVMSLYLEFQYLRKTFKFRVSPRALDVDPENPSVDIASEATAVAIPATAPVMVDYNTMRFVSRSAPASVGEPGRNEPIREMLI